jgi:hypothetical protein
MSEPTMTADVILRTPKVMRPPTVSSSNHQGSAKTPHEVTAASRELDNVAVRVTNVKGTFTPWSVHRPSQYLYTEPFQPLRFRVDIIDDEADLAAWRLAGFATNEPWQLRTFKSENLVLSISNST